MSGTALDPIVLAPDEGQPFNAFGASILLKTTAAQSNGEWFVLAGTAPPHSPGPAPHLHKVTTEIFVILEGEMTFRVGEQSRKVGPGGYAYIPPGVVHTFANESDTPVNYLGITSPALLEGYFHELMARVQGGDWPPQDMGEMLVLMEKYDSYPVFE